VHITAGSTPRHDATPSQITSIGFNFASHGSGPVQRHGDDHDQGATRDWPATLRQIAVNLSQSVPPLIYIWLAVHH
jgi:hypothetical protein